jgi:hypothetical protein
MTEPAIGFCDRHHALVLFRASLVRDSVLAAGQWRTLTSGLYIGHLLDTGERRSVKLLV